MLLNSTIMLINANIVQILLPKNFYLGLVGQDLVNLFTFIFGGGQDQWFATFGFVGLEVGLDQFMYTIAIHCIGLVINTK